jgi:hypothetical protein
VLSGFILDLQVHHDAATCVDIDLKPESDPNCINPNAGGRTSVAILTSEHFDAQNVDPNTLTFGGASGVQCGIEDSEPADGALDLACRYRVRDIADAGGWPAAGDDCAEVTLTGSLLDSGQEIKGSDVACIAGEATCEAGPQ